METFQVGPFTQQNFRFLLFGAAGAVLWEQAIFCPEGFAHIPCLKMTISKRRLSCFIMCHFECSNTYTEKHTHFLQFWLSKFASFSTQMLSCVSCHESVMFNQAKSNLFKSVWVQKMQADPPTQALVLSFGTHGIEKSTKLFKILYREPKFDLMISKFDVVMMMVSWSQNLKCPKSDHVKFWESLNLDHVKIWEHQKSDHVKIWNVPKIWSCQNLRTPKIWSCQKWETKILKSLDVDVIMISWKNVFLLC